MSFCKYTCYIISCRLIGSESKSKKRLKLEDTFNKLGGDDDNKFTNTNDKSIYFDDQGFLYI